MSISSFKIVLDKIGDVNEKEEETFAKIVEEYREEMMERD
jgi:hypothetical protein